MKSFLEPESVVLVGVSRRTGPGAYNNLEMLRRFGWEGRAYVVNPSGAEILGERTWRNVEDLPETPELAVISVGREAVPGALAACLQKGTRRAIVISQGFADADERGRALQRELASMANRAGARLLGPNTMGVFNAFAAFSTAFLDLPRPARPFGLSLAAQSGVFQVGPAQFIGPLGKVLDVGNMADVDFVDAIACFEADVETEVIALYMETAARGPELLRAIERASRRKPVVVLKSGRSAAGARAAVSHTGSLAGEDAAFDAAFERAGAVRVRSIPELRSACRGLLAWNPPLAGPRIGVFTATGAAGILAADACADQELTLAPFPEPLGRALASPKMDWYRLQNPADVWPLMMGSGDFVGFFRRTVEHFAADEQVDGMLGIMVCMDSPLHADQDLLAAARAASEANPARKPVALWLYGSGAERLSKAINEARIPGTACFPDPDAALAALRASLLCRDRSRRPPEPAPSPAEPKATLPPGSLVMGPRAERFVEAYGVRVAPSALCTTEADAVEAAERIGFPVVMKIVSDDWAHKSDRGGVEADLRDAAAVRAAFGRLEAAFRRHTPEARLDGILVQRREAGVELLVGFRRDPQFGPVVVLGAGGIHTETLRDAVREIAPVGIERATAMIDRLRIAPLLGGARGRPPADRATIARTVAAVSTLALAHPEVAEIDLNPVMAGPDGCTAVDVRIVRGERSA
jgi:acetyltransferase